MENTIKLERCWTNFENLKNSDIEKEVNITIYSDPHDLFIYSKRGEKMDGTVFGLYIQFGEEEGEGKRIMTDLSINELELFAHSLLKHINIIHKNYGILINKQVEIGSSI